MQLFYCEKCGLRIQQDDLNFGRARIEGDNIAFCPTCAAVPLSAPEPVAAMPSPVASSSRATQTNRVRRDQADKPAKAQLPVPLLAVGGVVLLVVVILLSRGKSDSVAEKTASTMAVAESKPKEKTTAKAKIVAETTNSTKAAPANPIKTEPETAVAPKTDSAVDFREGYAARRWADLKSGLEKPGSEWSGALSVSDFIRTYGSTASGREAAEWIKKEMSSGQPTAATTVAGYKRDFTKANPKQGWSYLWNGQGALGLAANYSSLVWNEGKQHYCGHETTFPCSPPASYTLAAPERIHPGPGVEQGEPFDRYFIAAYKLQPGQEGRMALSVRLKRIKGSHSSVEIQVLVNDSVKGRVTGTGEEMSGPLGVLSVGDTIYVAIGPNRADGEDGSELDFSIYKID